MTHRAYEVYSLMPGKDCGSCSNPSCRTMARKIVAGDTKVEQCINLARPEYKDNAEKIRKLLEEGVEQGARGIVVVGEEGITYIHPCISEAGKVTAEARLTSGPEGEVELKYGFYDPVMMCWILSQSGIFNNLKCSPRLGVARVDVDGKTIMVFQDGRINVRKAKDRKDALQAIRLVSRTLWGSIICSCCGNTGVDCASGGCEDCVTRVCPVLAGGPPDPLASTRGPSDQTVTSTIFDRAKKLEAGEYFFEGVRRLDRVMSLLAEVAQKISEGQFDRPPIKAMNEDIDVANRLAIRFIVETPRVQDATIGLILAGVSLDIRRMVAGLEALAENRGTLLETSRELLREAVDIADRAYNAYRYVNFQEAEGVKEAYQNFRRRWKQLFMEQPSEQDVLVAIEKIATNGFYIARLLTKPIPA